MTHPDNVSELGKGIPLSSIPHLLGLVVNKEVESLKATTLYDYDIGDDPHIVEMYKNYYLQALRKGNNTQDFVLFAIVLSRVLIDIEIGKREFLTTDMHYLEKIASNLGLQAIARTLAQEQEKVLLATNLCPGEEEL